MLVTTKANRQIVNYNDQIQDLIATKNKETFIDKLEKERRGQVESNDLKTHEECSNDSSKFFFVLDGKGSLFKSKG